MVILARSLCNVNRDTDINYIREKFDIGVRSMRAFEKEIAVHRDYFVNNEQDVRVCVQNVLDAMENK